MKKFAKLICIITMITAMFISSLPVVNAETTATVNNNVGVEAQQSENLVIQDSNSQVNVELGVGNVTDTATPGTIDKSAIESGTQNNQVATTESIDTSQNIQTQSVQNTAFSSVTRTTKLQKIIGNTLFDTANKVSKQGWPSGADTVILVNRNDMVSGVISAPLASTYDAPILLSEYSSIGSTTVNELKRLHPKRVFVIGNVSDTVANNVKSFTGASINKVTGRGTSELSAKVANIIKANHPVDTSYLVSTVYGFSDAVSIASRASETKCPIIVVDKDFINAQAFEFVKTTDNVYYIGGYLSISDALIRRISSNVKNGSLANRIGGGNRYEANINVINKFYPAYLQSIIVAKGENSGLIDSVSAAAFATKIKAPILLSETTRIDVHTNKFINSRRAGFVYQIGGGITDSIMNTLVAKLTGQVVKTSVTGKIIVIDPGHGGKDSGAVGINGAYEKDWNLVTALACAEYLRNAGADVVMTRSNDSFPTLQERVDISNARATVLYCSIHYNAGSSTANGVEVYKGDGPVANRAANCVLNSILDSFTLYNRGVKNNPGYYVLNNTRDPAILVEGGFMSNSGDVNILKSQAAQETMGIQIAKGIIASFN